MKPKIRLKRFEGEWSTIAMADAFEPLKNNSLSRAELSDSGDVMNIHYGDVLIKFGECIDTSKDILPFVKDENAAKNLFGSCKIIKGDIIFADAAEDNTVGKCSEVISSDEDKIVSGLHTIACRPKLEFAERYLGYYLNSPAFHNQLLPHIQGTKISSISRKAINSCELRFPANSVEQESIAEYFKSLDSQILYSTSHLESLKQVKVASLQAMFPQEEETKPKLRFNGFGGDWTKVKLGDVCIVYRGIRITRKELRNSGKYPVYQNTDYPMGYFNRYNVKGNNPFVIIGGSAGLIGFCEENFWAADDCAYFGDNDNLDKVFLYNTLLNQSTEISKNVRGSSVPRLERNILAQLSVSIPTIAEQKLIASYFSSLDAQISLYSKRVEKLKHIKSSCLDNMFV